VTAAIPLSQSPLTSAVGISCSFFLCLLILSNLHVIPIHLFGYGRAAFTASMLAFSYAALQMVFSPIVGALVDRFGFSVVCFCVAPLPLIGIWLMGTLKSE
jgi:MFS family permease